MLERKNVWAVCGSASANSSNLHLLKYIASLTKNSFNVSVYEGLKTLPPFDPDLSANNPPSVVAELRSTIAAADGVLICTPEYIFSLPSGLKNLFEWCVATTVFSGKPVGLITASAHGAKGHEELQRVVKTIEAKFTEETTLLIHGIKGKMNAAGELTDKQTSEQLAVFLTAFDELMKVNQTMASQ